MRWLKRDEGISMVLVGLLLAVLLGLTGMAVDLGAVYAERRELRNGADAAALAVAEDCVRGTRPCDQGTAESTAQEYADANSHDGVSGVEEVDLTLTGTDTGSVRVITSALDPSGNAGVPVPLMRLLGVKNRIHVEAPATAIFGFPASGQGLPMVVESYCVDQMGYAENAQSGYILLHTGSGGAGVGSCEDTEPAGQDAPGAFGWVDIDTTLPPDPVLGDCLASFLVGDWNDFANPGQGAGQPPKECEAATLEQAIYQKTIPVAVYSLVQDQGNNTQYWVVGFAALHVDAYRLGNKSGFFVKPPGFQWDNTVCPHSAMCLYGHFEEDIVTTGNTGGEDFGVVLVRLSE
jgi:hypothetical protein